MASLRFDPVPLLTLAPNRTEISRTNDSISYEVNGELLKSRIAVAVQDPFTKLSERSSQPLSPRAEFNARRIATIRKETCERRLLKLDSSNFAELAPVYKEFLQHSWSFKTYMNESLYGKDGYYTAKDGVGSDFGTANTHGACLARQVVNQAFVMYLKMVDAKDISGEHFDIVECGAGTGAMAQNILSYIEILGKTNPTDEKLQKFCKAVHYTIGEISPGLRARQIKLNQEFIDQGKLTIVPADARKLEAHFKKEQFAGLFVSNELPDAFPVHCINIFYDDQVYVVNVIPVIHQRLIANFRQEVLWDIRDQDTQFRNTFEPLFTLEEEINDFYLVSPEKVYLLEPEHRKHVMWKHVYVPVEYYPEVKDFLKSNPMFLERLNPNTDAYINTDATQFVKGVSSIMNKGFVMTVDYGDPYDNFSHENIREFGAEKDKRSHIPPMKDFHNGFQAVDLTVSVCYQSLAEASRELKPLGVIYQRELNQTMRAIGRRTFETERIKQHQYISARDYDADSFTVLVQAKETTKALYGIPAKIQPTTRQQITDFESSGSDASAQIENKSRLFANAWLEYKKDRSLLDADAREFGVFCKELYGKDFEPDLSVASGIVNGEPKGTEVQKSLIQATLQAINSIDSQ